MGLCPNHLITCQYTVAEVNCALRRFSFTLHLLPCFIKRRSIATVLRDLLGCLHVPLTFCVDFF